MRIRSAFPLVVASLTIALGCGAGEAAAPDPLLSPPPSAAKAPSAPPGHLLRAEVDRVLKLGPSWVFRRVLYKPVIGQDGKFVGWRIEGLPEEWSGIDLQPGDVVQKVNGTSLETPDSTWVAWTSVAKERQIRVALDRGGKPHEVVIPIDGEPSAETARALEQPPPQRPAGPGQRGVIRIGGDEPQEEGY